MKKFKYFILIAFVLPLCLLFTGCNQVVVNNISKTDSNGNMDIYTIYFSDGTTSNFEVENGKNGKDLNLEELFALCVDKGLYTDGEFDKFLSDYVANRIDKNVNLYNAFNSAVSICARFGGSRLSAGAGVIYKMDENDSYILTNCHVVSDYDNQKTLQISNDIRVWQYGANNFVNFTHKETYANFESGIAAKCIGYSEEYDLAILKLASASLTSFNENACAVKVATGYTVAENVYAIGNPEAEGISVTSGIVSVVSEDITVRDKISGVELNLRCMRIDCPVYSGNSGGGLFNENGELVGIVNASSEDADNYNYAIPIDNIVQVAKNLIENGSEMAPYILKHRTLQDLGATIEEQFESFNNLTGELKYKVVVTSLSNGVLYKSGLKLNDEIVSVIVDGQEYTITREFQIDDLLIGTNSNSTITFKVENDNISRTITLSGTQIGM